VKNLTIISNNCGADGFGLWMLLKAGQIRKMISSYVGENGCLRSCICRAPGIGAQPQGTLAERIRAGGAGIRLLHSDGRWHGVAEHKQWKYSKVSAMYVRPGCAQISHRQAYKADSAGNLIYRKTARNFNPVMATAAKVTVAEVEEIVRRRARS